MTEDNHFVSMNEVGLQGEAWANVRGWWRAVRVVDKGRRLVLVAFRLRGGRALRRQAIPLRSLRRTRPSSHHLLDDPAPGQAGIQADAIGRSSP